MPPRKFSTRLSQILRETPWDKAAFYLLGAIVIGQFLILWWPAPVEQGNLTAVSDTPPSESFPVEETNFSSAGASTASESTSKPRRKKKSAKSQKPRVAFPLSLNQASAVQLQAIPGIGPKLSQRIIDYRKSHGPFQTLEELKEVRGIGDKTFAKFKPYLYLPPAKASTPQESHTP